MNEKIEYWLDYWDELLDGEEAQVFPLNMINPRTVLKEFADEIEFNHLANADNKKFFMGKIKYYLECDPGVQPCLKEVFTAITREFQKPRHGYLLELCRQAQKTFDSLYYFDACVDALKSTLLDPSPLTEADKQRCALIARDVFVELMEIGYSKEYTERVPKRLFGDYQIVDGHILTDFPHDIPFPEGETPDVGVYNSQLKERLDSLTDADRVEALKSIANAQMEELTYIFQIRGLRGNAELQVGPVLFYPPHLKKLVTDYPIGDSDIEFLGTKEGSNFLNAAVTVLTREAHSGSTDARRLVIGALNVIRFNYGSKASFQIGPSYIVTRPGGKYAAGSHTVDRTEQFWIWQDSLELSSTSVAMRPAEFDKIGTLFVKSTHPSRDDIDRRIVTSIHWHRRAREAESETDQLLWYWITIENMLHKRRDAPNAVGVSDQTKKTITVALGLLPSVRSKSIAFQKGWVLRRKIFALLKNRRITLPSELIEKADLLDGPRTILLPPFVDSIPEIAKNVHSRLLIDQLDRLYRFYTDSDFALKSLNEEKAMAREELLLIYRMRNKIVHNAEYETPMLPHAISSAHLFSGNLLWRITQIRCQREITTVEEAVEEILCDYDLFIENIKSKTPREVLLKS